MKKFKPILSTMLLVIFALMCMFSACDISSGTGSGSQSGTQGGSSAPSSTGEGQGNTEPPAVFTVDYRKDYAPTKFDKNSVTYDVTEISDGLVMVKNTLTKSNGTAVVVYTLEVDLKKVTIAAGTKDNTTELSKMQTALPSSQATAYESATGKTVYAYLNADFFGSQPVNAFVKDGIVVKNMHNDNGSYDYLNLSADVPASAPMLFGINGEKAQVAPVISYTGDVTSAEVKKALVQAKLTQKIALENSENAYDVTTESDSIQNGIVLNTSKTARTCKAGDYALKVSVANGLKRMRVMQTIECSVDTRFTSEGNYAYLFVGKKSSAATEFSDIDRKYLSCKVSSPDGKWNGYTTILGCRQSLVENSAVAKTVSVENTNGAQSSDVPRSAVGVKKDGTVVIFAVESLYYGKKAKTGDTHGMNLPELADFMTYYGIVDGANFDGGGSTQLTVNKGTQKTVVVRSSDTGSFELDSSRKVMNTVLVVEK